MVGSLRNPRVPEVAKRLREAGHEVFDDWHSGGPDADDHLWAYERARGRNMRDALEGYACKHIFEFDKFHIDRADIGVLVMPAGKSGHLELGYMLGQGKKGYILMDGDPDRIEVMMQFATAICYTVEELIEELAEPEVWFCTVCNQRPCTGHSYQWRPRR